MADREPVTKERGLTQDYCDWYASVYVGRQQGKARVPRNNVVSHGAEVEEAQRLRNRVAELEQELETKA